MLVEFVELPGHPFWIGTQAHPELKSRPNRPAPLFDAFIAAALQRAETNDPERFESDATATATATVADPSADAGNLSSDGEPSVASVEIDTAAANGQSAGDDRATAAVAQAFNN
jgi:CTP synthase